MRERRSESERPSPAALERHRLLGRSPSLATLMTASAAGGVQVRSGADAEIGERRNGVGDQRERGAAGVARAACGARDLANGQARTTVRQRRPKSAGAEPSPFRSDQDSARAYRSAERPPAKRRAGKIPAPAGVGALRGVPARMGSARRRLACGERPFPGIDQDGAGGKGGAVGPDHSKKRRAPARVKAM